MTPRLRRRVAPGHVVEGGVEPDVAADRQVHLLDRRPQRVVALVEVLGQVELVRVHRQLQRLGPQVGHPADLGDGRVDVVDRDLVRNDQTLGVDGAEVVEGVVERPGGVPPSILHAVQEAVGADLAVQHLGIDAVGVHVLQPLVRIGLSRAGPMPDGRIRASWPDWPCPRRRTWCAPSRRRRRRTRRAATLGSLAFTSSWVTVTCESAEIKRSTPSGSRSARCVWRVWHGDPLAAGAARARATTYSGYYGSMLAPGSGVDRVRGHRWRTPTGCSDARDRPSGCSCRLAGPAVEGLGPVERHHRDAELGQQGLVGVDTWPVRSAGQSHRATMPSTMTSIGS